MTVAELAALLALVPGDLPVCVRGQDTVLREIEFVLPLPEARYLPAGQIFGVGPVLAMRSMD